MTEIQLLLMRKYISKVRLDSQNEHITLTLKSREKAEKIASGIMFDISEMPFDFCVSYLTLGILRAGYTQFAANKIAYLPASRTGFVLTYKTLSENSMAQKFNMGEMNKNFLTKPSSDFLGRLSTISTQHEYQTDDMISSEKIRVYQFETKQDNSEVVPVLCGENGFVASTFIRTLQQMVWESGEMD